MMHPPPQLYQDKPLDTLSLPAPASSPSEAGTLERLARLADVVDDARPSPVISKSRQIALPVAVVIPLQEWEGHVVEIGDDDFTVSLVDITRGDKHESEDAVIPLKELSKEDAANLSPGKIFRWVVGPEYSTNGDKTTVSHIVFRDLPRITDEDMNEAREWAREYGDWLSS